MTSHATATLPSTSTSTPQRRRWAHGWTLERVLFAMAGTLVLTGSILAATVSPWFLLLTGFASINQLAFAAIGDCGASLVLRRALHLTAANDG